LGFQSPHCWGSKLFVRREAWKLEVVGRWGCGWEWMCFTRKLDSKIFKVGGKMHFKPFFLGPGKDFLEWALDQRGTLW